MKTMILTLAGAAVALVSLAGAANAAPQRPIPQRAAAMSMRIDQGVRSGTLSRREAARLHQRLATLRLRARHDRRGGMTFREHSRLDRRFAALGANIHAQKHDVRYR